MALTRAQQICFIMGPLDMRGLVGAATIIGCLKYGGLDDQDDPVFLIRLKDEDLLQAPDDSAFLQSLRFSCATFSGVYPPLALVEAYITEEDSAPRVRRQTQMHTCTYTCDMYFHQCVLKDSRSKVAQMQFVYSEVTSRCIWGKGAAPPAFLFFKVASSHGTNTTSTQQQQQQQQQQPQQQQQRPPSWTYVQNVQKATCLAHTIRPPHLRSNDMEPVQMHICLYLKVSER